MTLRGWLHNKARPLSMNPGPLSSLARGLTRREHLRRFVPAHAPVRAEQVETLQRFMDESRRLFVLTGAGISTESGIPDYRSEEVGVFARTTDRPVRYQEFVTSASARQRYWARNFVGWPGFSSSQPNASHRVLSRWERVGRLHWLVTQNVDRLHQKAGSEKVTELHGCAHRVTCLSCSSLMSRDQLQQLILKYNADWKAEAVDVSPDGDVQLSARQVEGFRVPPCPECNGILKPNVVFFGDNVKRNTVDFIFQKLKECDSVLVVGSSLQVYSGFRFIVTAVEKGKPTAIVNIGPTRADALTQLKVSACSTEILTRMIVH